MTLLFLEMYCISQDNTNDLSNKPHHADLENTNIAQNNQRIILPGVTVDRAIRQVITQGAVNMQNGMIELLATTPVGKRHESILVLNCPPQILNSALLLIGLNPSGVAILETPESPPQGDTIYIYVCWELEGKTQQMPAENLIWDRKKQATMSPNGWVFTGSRFIKTTSGRPYFGATPSGILCATYYDPDAVINNCLPERHDDTNYEANSNVLPKCGTVVKVIFSAIPIEK